MGKPQRGAAPTKGRGGNETAAGAVWASRALQICLVAVLAFGVYANTLSNGFVDDDEAQVLRNPWITDARFIPTMFSQSVWSFLRSGVSNYYRPLMHLIYLINFHLFGFRAWGFHLVNVLLHVGNTILVFFLAARLTSGDGASDTSAYGERAAPRSAVPFVAALFFAVHPVHTEAVAWIASVPELSFTLCSLGAMLLHIAPGKRSVRKLACSAGLFLLALLCKETALTLPVLLVVYDLACDRGGRSLREYVVAYALYLLAAGLYLTVRYHVLWATLIPATGQWNLSCYELAINVLPLFSEYVRMLILPVGLKFWHSFHPITSLLTLRGLCSVAVGTIFLTAVACAWKWRRESLFCLSLVVLPLAPALYISALPMKPFAERYLYFSSVGFVMLAAMALARLSAVKGMRVVAVVVAVSVTAVYCAATVDRNRVWESPYTLFADTVRQAPDAKIPRYDLAIALANLGRVDEAIEHYRILVEADPTYVAAQSALGSALLLKGRLDEAIERLKTAVALDPRVPESYNDLGVAMRKKGDVDGAVRYYRQALVLDPDFADAHFNLGSALADTGHMEEAMEHYRTAVRLRPENAYYRNVIGIEYGKQRLLDEAIEQFREAVRLAPGEPAYARNLERALALQQWGQRSPE